MPPSEEFKAALRSGNLSKAFAVATAQATTLKITTWIKPSRRTRASQNQYSPKLQTQIDLLKGTIDNEVDEPFTDSTEYQQLQQFHQQQVALGHHNIQDNFQSLHQLLQLLTTLQQYHRLEAGAEPLDLSFLEASTPISPATPGTGTPPDANVPLAASSDSMVFQEKQVVSTTATENQVEQTATFLTTESLPDEGLNRETSMAAIASQNQSSSSIQSPVADQPAQNSDALINKVTEETVTASLPVSELEIDDWEKPPELTPTQRLTQQTANDAYIPSLSDFEQDESFDDLYSLDDLFEIDDLLTDEADEGMPNEPVGEFSLQENLAEHPSQALTHPVREEGEPSTSTSESTNFHNSFAEHEDSLEDKDPWTDVNDATYPLNSSVNGDAKTQAQAE